MLQHRTEKSPAYQANDRLAAHAVVQQNQSVGPTGQAMRGCATEPSRIGSIRSCRDSLSRKPGRIHSASRIPLSRFGKRFVRLLVELGVEPQSVDLFHCSHSAGQAVDRRIVEQAHGQQAQTDRAHDVGRIVVPAKTLAKPTITSRSSHLARWSSPCRASRRKHRLAQGGCVRPAVPGSVRDHAHHHRRPASSWRAHRHHRHLGLGDDAPSAPPRWPVGNQPVEAIAPIRALLNRSVVATQPPDAFPVGPVDDLGELPACPCPRCGRGTYWRQSVLSGGPGSWQCQRCVRPDPGDWIDGCALPVGTADKRR